jgi:hypothetical protein
VLVNTIHKYEVRIDDEFAIDMPKGARLLSVQTQGGIPFLWALVDTDAKQTLRTFALRGTGHPAGGLDFEPFVGTFQLNNGALVFHLFDLGEPK